MRTNDSSPVTPETALRSILRALEDTSLNEKRLRIQVWGFAKAAVDLIEAERLQPVVGAKPAPAPVRDSVLADVPVVAWLHVWGDRKVVKRDLADDKYGLSEAIPLCFVECGDVLAWQWGDGGGYNASYRYSFVDPREDPEEVEAQGAESVIGCRALYLHPLVKGYKAGEAVAIV